jgi:transcriptional regulator with XRE-family HTH domain
MDLASLGRLISERRCAQGFTLARLAEAARVGRSTLAALESGRLPELGFNKVARICAAAGIRLETRPPLLPHPSHYRLADANGRELTKEVIRGLILRGGAAAWRDLLRALKKDDRGLLAARVRQVVGTLEQDDPSVVAFTARLPPIMRRAIARAARRR